MMSPHLFLKTLLLRLQSELELLVLALVWLLLRLLGEKVRKKLLKEDASEIEHLSLNKNTSSDTKESENTKNMEQKVGSNQQENEPREEDIIAKGTVTITGQGEFTTPKTDNLT